MTLVPTEAVYIKKHLPNTCCPQLYLSRIAYLQIEHGKPPYRLPGDARSDRWRSARE